MQPMMNSQIRRHRHRRRHGSRGSSQQKAKTLNQQMMGMSINQVNVSDVNNPQVQPVQKGWHHGGGHHHHWHKHHWENGEGREHRHHRWQQHHGEHHGEKGEGWWKGHRGGGRHGRHHQGQWSQIRKQDFEQNQPKQQKQKAKLQMPQKKQFQNIAQNSDSKVLNSLIQQNPQIIQLRESILLNKNPSQSDIKQKQQYIPISSELKQSKIRESLLCPISQDIMKSPVMIGVCGHTFEDSYIRAWLKKSAYCPVCRKETDQSKLVRNILVLQLIDAWKQ